MQHSKHLLVSIFLIAFIGCDKNEEDMFTVPAYVSLLKTSQYSASTLPEFDQNAIPALLEYRNENEIITNFPRNPISSLAHPECVLGTYILWTIESIRSSSNGKAVMGFPSQNPILAYRETNELVDINDSRSHEVAAQAYLEWWENNKDKDFDVLKTIDPLANTDYRWR